MLIILRLLEQEHLVLVVVVFLLGVSCFENFVVGPSNTFAHAAALAVAKKMTLKAPPFREDVHVFCGKARGP